MRSITYHITFVILFNFLFSIGGLGVSGLTISENINYIETDSNLELSYVNRGIGLGGNFFIYFDALPMGFAIEYSKEIMSNPLNMKMVNEERNQSYDFGSDIPQAQISDYFTVRKEMMSLSIPFLAKSAIYIGGGFNTHQTVYPSIQLLKTAISESDQISSDDLIDEFNLYNPSFNIFDFEDYFEDSNGLHLQAGIQIKLLMFNTFINARYTFITKDNSSLDRQGFMNILFGLAIGI
ncbi:MAG: hypothetical protein CMG67_03170 [Candidatus Marinimicrobia bacterium]|nr:hypothetical protein [Candidatus Neomarinimicrobiota bacterium]|tara:strand:+ start:731 stop:1441 length:711 start_codon:yes stop_codon:yes gene_type:complete